MASLWSSIQHRLSLEEIASRGAGIVFTIFLAWIVFWVLRRALIGGMRAADSRVEDPAHRQRIATLVLLVVSITKYVVIFVAAVMILQRQLGLNVYPVLAGAGVVGLAVGFGAQNLVRDVVSGFFIIMEGQYAVGDLVEINGAFGRVEEVGLRTTRMRDPNGEIRSLPNGAITTANNYTQRYIAYTVTVPFARDATGDLPALVRRILDDFEREFQVFAGPPQVGEAEELPTYARLIRAAIRVIPGRHPIVEQKLAGRMTAALDRAGHPLPQGTDVGVVLRPLAPPR